MLVLHCAYFKFVSIVWGETWCSATCRLSDEGAASTTLFETQN